MELKKLEARRGAIAWPKDSNDLPIMPWEEFQRQYKTSNRSLIVIGGFIHDVGDFIDHHPGGYGIIKHRLGKDATTAFNGGVYDHSNAAHNYLAMLRVGCIEGGYEVEALKSKPAVPLADSTPSVVKAPVVVHHDVVKSIHQRRPIEVNVAGPPPLVA